MAKRYCELPRSINPDLKPKLDRVLIVDVLLQNTSVLENHHWRSAVGCLLESHVAEKLSPIIHDLESQISSLILATDITRQPEFLKKFTVSVAGEGGQESCAEMRRRNTHHVHAHKIRILDSRVCACVYDFS